MRKLILLACVALGVSCMAKTSVQSAPSNLYSQEGIAPSILEQVYQAVACETGFCIAEVRTAHAEGQLEIEKDSGIYRALYADAEGNILEIIILDDF